MSAKTKWKLQADYLQACSCDYGCPCEFEAPPSRGFCEGAGAWRIEKGNYGDLSLDGLHLAFVIRFPAAMHLGNGTAGLLIDERANARQREALVQIGTGKPGGMPFEIFAAVTSTWLEPRYVSFQYHVNGRNSSVTAGDALAITVEPIKNPVNGAPESIRVEHSTGFLFKMAEVVSGKDCMVSTGTLTFSWPNKAGFYARVNYSN